MGDTDRFIDNGDGTVTDRKTGLMWKKTDTMIDLKKWVNYQDSADYVRELREQGFAGFDDWRLPTQDEAQTLYDESLSLTDKFGKTVHISDRFEPGCGFSMIIKLVDGRLRTSVFNIREGTLDYPDGLWTLSEAARAVRIHTSPGD
ncbi:Lcl C-terminal domain-containing protein [Nitrospina watsonii]|uniref:Lcl C-terminal domain-containing protein n=1 Tax=Nitrospina watsonii TaxID=1323948 RepID=A0ABN8W2P8_9BACT|nr:DUF1566 domain-containing protein [Nitrospina watsonii]CAI2718243.1 conserved protein of unknown function [Nitrospina watsonii]